MTNYTSRIHNPFFTSSTRFNNVRPIFSTSNIADFETEVIAANREDNFNSQNVRETSVTTNTRAVVPPNPDAEEELMPE